MKEINPTVLNNTYKSVIIVHLNKLCVVTPESTSQFPLTPLLCLFCLSTLNAQRLAKTH